MQDPLCARETASWQLWPSAGRSVPERVTLSAERPPACCGLLMAAESHLPSACICIHFHAQRERDMCSVGTTAE